MSPQRGGLQVHLPDGKRGQGVEQHSALDAKVVFRETGVDGILDRAVLREACYLCHHCGAGLPKPDDTVEVAKHGPVILLAEGGSNRGILDRTRGWYCIACAVNHRYGQEVRRAALRDGWGKLLAWKQDGVRCKREETVQYLSDAMHRAAKAGAQNALPWLSAAGLEFGDLWILPLAKRQNLARMAEGFPIKRPENLKERNAWSGPRLVEKLRMEYAGIWTELYDSTFVILNSECLMAPIVASYEPPAERQRQAEVGGRSEQEREEEAAPIRPGDEDDPLRDLEEPELAEEEPLYEGPDPFAGGGYGTFEEGPPPSADEEAPPDY